MRAALIMAAIRGEKVTYGELELATGGGYLSRGFGPALDVLSVDCGVRGEPSLSPLVVTSGGEVGSAFVGDPDVGRQDAWTYWKAKAGRS